MNTILTDDELKAECRVGFGVDPVLDGSLMKFARAVEAAVLAKLEQQADRQRVPKELTRYEPVVVVEESRGRLTAKGAAMEEKPEGRWVRWSDVLDAAPEAPAQASAVDEREAFEAWAIDQPYIAAKNLWDERSRYGKEEYESHEVQLMWEAWRDRAAAALESVSYSDPSIQSALAVVRAAIAKATGEKA